MNIRLRYGLVFLILVPASIFIAPYHVFPFNSKRCPVKREVNLSVLPYAICLGKLFYKYSLGSTLPAIKNQIFQGSLKERRI